MVGLLCIGFSFLLRSLKVLRVDCLFLVSLWPTTWNGDIPLVDMFWTGDMIENQIYN